MMKIGGVAFRLLFASALALNSSTGAAQTPKSSPASKAADKPAPAPAPFDQKRFDELRAEGFEALYNLDYEGARRRFVEMTRVFPDHPAGYQFIAVGVWLKTLNESRRLQSALYNQQGFYKEKDDKVDPKVAAEFHEMTLKAKQLGEARLKRNPKDVEALYYLGGVEGLKAAWGGMVERSFMSALHNGSDAVDRHREVLKLDPNFTDAKVTIGMYDYVVGTLPPLVRVGATMIGVHGSRRRGLAEMEDVAHNGKWAQDDAKSLLIALLKREGRFRDAYTYASELATKYPRNYLFKMEAADALVSQAEVDRARDPEAAKKTEGEAFAIFDALVAAAEHPAPNTPRPPLELVHYNYGDALLVAGEADRAAKELLAAASVAGAEPSMVTRAQLRAAQALDVAGKRDEALTQYKAVLARPNVFDSHEDARRGLKEPYRLTRKVADGASDEGADDAAKTAKAN
jgi:tetratricopeptide (TPR) repeat protein